MPETTAKSRDQEKFSQEQTQHETLHHGMWAFYSKIADLPLPESWKNAWTLT